MSLDTPEKFPYLARQINGPIAESFGKGFDFVYEQDLDFLDFLSRFSIDALSGEWLDRLGIVLGLPRPWLVAHFPEDAFQFDIIERVLNGKLHGFSTNTPVVIEGETVTRDDGGKLDDLTAAITPEKLNDEYYRQYLKCAALAKKKHSISGICDVMELFCDSSRYVVEFNSQVEYVGDIMIYIAGNLQYLKPFLQSAFDNMFTTAPRIFVNSDAYFEEREMVPEIKKIVKEITGSDFFTVTYFYEYNSVWFVVELDPQLEEYQAEVQAALDEKYAGQDDIHINVTLGYPYFKFDFDNNKVLGGKAHGFSTDQTMVVGDETVTPNDGGHLDNKTNDY